MAVPLGLDHIVLATPDLEPTVEWVAQTLGVRPAAGGQHVGAGSRNFLLSIGPGHYLEVIGPDPAQPEPPGPRPFGIDKLDRPRLKAWVAKAAQLEEAVAKAALVGHHFGPIRQGSRTTPDGRVLRWRVTDLTASEVAVIPPLIDWGDTAHPSSASPAGALLVAFKAVHPQPDRVRAVLAALGLDLDITIGREPRLTANVSGPGGLLELS